jgi:hypothetical protein
MTSTRTATTSIIYVIKTLIINGAALNHNILPLDSWQP